MKNDSLLTFTLGVQLILAFFCPPLPFEGRLVFGADLWIFMWVPILGTMMYVRSERADTKKIIYQVAASFGILLVVFLHGKTRPAVSAEFIQYIGSSGDDGFTFVKEAVIAFRFFIWFLAGLIVANSVAPLLNLQNVLALCSVISALTIIAGGISPELRSLFGAVYHYNPDGGPWPERSYGVFRSPIEGCLTLCFSIILLSRGSWASNRIKFPVFAAIILGILYTKTLTGLVALVIALLYPLAKRLNRRDFKIALMSLCTLTLSLAAVFWDTAYLTLKRGNLIFRLKPWEIYWDIAVSRLDYVIVGTGFHPYFTDNILLFFFSRGGLLLSGTVVGLSILWWKRNQYSLRSWQVSVPLFFIISGVTVDSLIMRPVAYTLICVGLLFLQVKMRPGEKGSPRPS